MSYSHKSVQDTHLNHFGVTGMNGMDHKSHNSHNTPGPSKPKNYKLLVDPFLVKGTSKLYRYDGLVPNDSSYPPVNVRDPRSHLIRRWTRLESLDLPVPR